MIDMTQPSTSAEACSIEHLDQDQEIAILLSLATIQSKKYKKMHETEFDKEPFRAKQNVADSAKNAANLLPPSTFIRRKRTTYHPSLGPPYVDEKSESASDSASHQITGEYDGYGQRLEYLMTPCK